MILAVDYPIADLLARYGLQLSTSPDATIPGSYWGAPEAGLIGATLHISADTPLHSALHEAAHFVCMDDARRAILHTDAGGSDAEEAAVCYLQILLARELGIDGDAFMADMDAWGYSFRLGSTQAWFRSDASDARDWLLDLGLIDRSERPAWRLRRNLAA